MLMECWRVEQMADSDLQNFYKSMKAPNNHHLADKHADMYRYKFSKSNSNSAKVQVCKQKLN
jgi:hypothetical protein